MSEKPPSTPSPDRDENENDERFRLGRKSWKREAEWIGETALDPEWSEMFDQPTPEEVPVVLLCPYCSCHPCECEM